MLRGAVFALEDISTQWKVSNQRPCMTVAIGTRPAIAACPALFGNFCIRESPCLMINLRCIDHRDKVPAELLQPTQAEKVVARHVFLD